MHNNCLFCIRFEVIKISVQLIQRIIKKMIIKPNKNRLMNF